MLGINQIREFIFLANIYKTILVFGLFGLFGLFGATLFNNASPKEYEATIFIKMIEVSDYNGILSKVEDPKLLIARLKQPSTYSQKEVDSCLLVEAKFPFKELVGKVTASLVGGADSVVQLKIKLPTKKMAAQCMQAIYEMISEQQLRIKSDRDNRNLIALSQYRKQYKELEAIDASGNLSMHERYELRLLLEKINILEFAYATTQNQATVIVPIYVSENPFLLMRMVILAFGFLIGLFLGWIVLNGVQIWKIYGVKK